MSYWVARKKHPVVIHGENHIVVLVHYAPPVIKVIDNAGPGKGLVRLWTVEKFDKWWSGRAYVIFAD